MPENNDSLHNVSYPLPHFYFQVDFGDLNETASFQEVSGLDITPQTIEYRHGDSKQFANIKMPGLTKIGNVTLKKGVLTKDSSFWNWSDMRIPNTIKRTTVVIKLMDETGNPLVQWQLTNAWATKIAATGLKSEGNEVAVESVEIAFEQMVVSNP